MRTLLVERATRLEETGAGLQLSPNAGRVLDALGLGPALDGASVRPEAIRIGHGRSGRTLADIPLGSGAERRYGAPYRVLHRADLQRVLVEAVAREPLIELRLGETVVDVTGDSPAVVSESARGRSEHYAYAVVGADGVRSAIRATTGGRGLPEPRYIAWRAMADAARAGGAMPATRIWLAPGAHLVAYPVANREQVNLVLVTPAPAAGEAPPREAVAAFGGPAADLLGAAERWTAWPLFDVEPALRFGEGPITLIGDAAHPVLPFIAQGAALAIEDAAVLAHHLARGPDPARAARAYETLRAPRWRRVAAAAAANGRIYHLSGIAAGLRDAALRAAPPGRLLARYDWLFGWRPPG